MSFVILPLREDSRTPRVFRVLLMCDGVLHLTTFLPRATVTLFDDPFIKPHWRLQAVHLGWRFLDNDHLHGPCCPGLDDRRTRAKYPPRSGRRPGWEGASGGL